MDILPLGPEQAIRLMVSSVLFMYIFVYVCTPVYYTFTNKQSLKTDIVSYFYAILLHMWVSNIYVGYLSFTA